LIAQPVPLDISLSVRGRAPAARTFSVLNFNFEYLSLMQIAEWDVADRISILAKHRNSSQ